MKSFFALMLLALTVFASLQSHAAISNAQQPMVAVIDLGSITADADTYGIYLPKKSKIVSVKLVNGASIAQSDTDKAVITLQNGATVLATHSTALTSGTSALTANTPAAATLATALVDSSGEISVDGGSYLKVTYDESGTYAMTLAKVIVVYYPL